MESKIKRIFWMCLSVCMVLSVLQMPTYAAQTEGSMILTKDTQIHMSLTGDLYVDMNGYSLTGTINTILQVQSCRYLYRCLQQYQGRCCPDLRKYL